MNPHSTDKFISINELADLLGGIGRSTVYRHIKSLPGFPKPVKVGAATRFRLSEVQAFIADPKSLEGGLK